VQEKRRFDQFNLLQAEVSCYFDGVDARIQPLCPHIVEDPSCFFYQRWRRGDIRLDSSSKFGLYAKVTVAGTL